jgi:hypothetical protein
MTLKALFEMLGAPLKNYRWSWGAVRPREGAVFLRVWEDRKRLYAGSQYVQVTHLAHYRDNESNLGHRERQEHVNLIHSGAPTYLVFCKAVDEHQRPRRVSRFNRNQVFPGGRVVELDGETWVEVLSPVPVKAVAP